jgi:hypothetical protein
MKKKVVKMQVAALYGKLERQIDDMVRHNYWVWLFQKRDYERGTRSEPPCDNVLCALLEHSHCGHRFLLEAIPTPKPGWVHCSLGCGRVHKADNPNPIHDYQWLLGEFAGMRRLAGKLWVQLDNASMMLLSSHRHVQWHKGNQPRFALEEQE